VQKIPCFVAKNRAFVQKLSKGVLNVVSLPLTINQKQMTIEQTLPDLAQLWKESHGDPAVKVAIIDAGVDAANPALKGANLKFINNAQGDSPSDQGEAIQHDAHIAAVTYSDSTIAEQKLAPATVQD
jgi:subtilisin family serine protease